MGYLKRHFTGQHPLWQSVIVNGVLAYIVVVALLVSIGNQLPGPGFLVIGIVVFFAWYVWWAVGAWRCAMNASADSGWIKRIAALATIALVVLVTIVFAQDVLMITSL